MGFCVFNNVADRRARRAARARPRAHRDRRLRRSPRQRDGAIFRGDDTVLFVSLHQWPFYPGHRRPRRPGRDDAQHPAAGGLGRRGVSARLRARRSSRRSRASTRSSCSSRPGFDAHEDDPLAEMRVSEDGFRELARRCARDGAARRRRARGRLRARDAARPRRRPRSTVFARQRKGPFRGPCAAASSPPTPLARLRELGV